MATATFELDVVSHQRYEWRQKSEDVWRCGDIELRRTPEPEGGRPWCTWYYWIKIKGRFRKAWPKTRPYGYSHVSNAKVGFNQIQFFEYEP